LSGKTRNAPRRILIAVQDTALRQQVRSLLEAARYEVVADTDSGEAAIQTIRRLRIDLLIADAALLDRDGIEVAATVSSGRSCPVILLSTILDRDTVLRAAAAGVFAYLVPPITDLRLLSAIELSYGRWRTERAADVHMRQLQAKLKERDLIECAKKRLMAGYHLNEQQAFRQIRQRSMCSGRTMGKVAEQILASTRIVHHSQTTNDTKRLPTTPPTVATALTDNFSVSERHFTGAER
jgi:two-component system, response regulator PdtaR